MVVTENRGQQIDFLLNYHISGNFTIGSIFSCGSKYAVVARIHTYFILFLQRKFVCACRLNPCTAMVPVYLYVQAKPFMEFLFNSTGLLPGFNVQPAGVMPFPYFPDGFMMGDLMVNR